VSAATKPPVPRDGTPLCICKCKRCFEFEKLEAAEEENKEDAPVRFILHLENHLCSFALPQYVTLYSAQLSWCKSNMS
jgi:hypothetical protein